MDPKFRNVICPWQTKSDIKSQQKTLVKMLKWLKLPTQEEEILLGLDKPDRVWKR